MPLAVKSTSSGYSREKNKGVEKQPDENDQHFVVLTNMQERIQVKMFLQFHFLEPMKLLQESHY
jgi:hypothetical protein